MFPLQTLISHILLLDKRLFSPGKVSIVYTFMQVLAKCFYILAWDLLRIDVYGFKSFCKYFLETYPGYFISPLRISGSAVESLFSQYKYNAGGKLDSCNYVTVRCAHLVQQCATGHHSGVGYRDQTLTHMELPLKKKRYGNS